MAVVKALEALTQLVVLVAVAAAGLPVRLAAPALQVRVIREAARLPALTVAVAVLVLLVRLPRVRLAATVALV